MWKGSGLVVLSHMMISFSLCVYVWKSSALTKDESDWRKDAMLCLYLSVSKKCVFECLGGITNTHTHTPEL